MTLKQWLKANKVSQYGLAMELRLHPQYVSRWINGRSYPTHKHMKKIYDYTDKQVTPNDWHGMP